MLALLFCSFTGPFLGLGVMDLTGWIGAYKSYGTAVVAFGYDSLSGIVALAPGRIGAAAGFPSLRVAKVVVETWRSSGLTVTVR